MKIKHIKTLDTHPSSNKYIKEHKNEKLENTVVRVVNQTAGVGRRGTTWNSSAELDLTFSFYVVLGKTMHHLVFMATIVALHKVLRQYDITSFTKLPNDIYVSNKKIAGILMESTHVDDYQELIVGVGLNVNEHNPEKHDELATSMRALNQNGLLDVNQILLDFVRVYNELVIDEELFNRFKATIPFNKHDAFLNDGLYNLIDITEDFDCMITNDDNDLLVPCTNLTFKVKK